jgi:hypothetical protein
MPTDSPTLGDLFGVIRNQSSEEVTKQIAESQSLKEIGAIPEVLRTPVARLVGGKLADLLDTPLVKILADAWKGAKAWKRLAADSGEQVVPLNPHTISSTHHPTLQILWKEQPIGPPLTFEAKVTLNFENAALIIRDRTLRELRPGTTRVEGTLFLSRVKLLKRSSKDYTLPGVLSFGEGIPISL